MLQLLQLLLLLLKLLKLLVLSWCSRLELPPVEVPPVVSSVEPVGVPQWVPVEPVGMPVEIHVLAVVVETHRAVSNSME